MDIRKNLYELADKEYAEFQSKLTPTVERSKFIGVRVPALRKLAKEIYNSEDYADFLCDLPHKYYDENMLHGLIISEIKDFDQCIAALNAFLPFVDNWAVCDTMSPKCFKKHKEKLLPHIMNWVGSAAEYSIRFGLETMMSYFLDEDFEPEYLKIAASVKSEEYYVNMMIAWFFATALAKQWDDAVGYISSGLLDPWVHNKTIQKARESYRITSEQKQYLSALRIKKTHMGISNE